MKTSARTFLLRTFSIVLLLVMAGAPLRAQTAITYSLGPVGEGVRWDDNAGLSDAFFYGGEVGLRFGSRMEASGLYLRGNDVETDFADFSGEPALVNQGLGDVMPREVDVQRYGGRLQLNLNSGSITPYLDLGTGIIRFEPSALESSQSIYVAPGAGFILSSTSGYTLSAAADLLTYRYNPADFLSEVDAETAGQERADFDTRTVYSPSIRTSLAIRLGGPAPRRSTARRRSLLGSRGGPRFFVEPFYGQVNFNDNLSFAETQPIAGLTAGAEIGSYVTLSGFYWRGTQDEKVLDTELPDAFDDIQFYGGEADLRLNTDYAGGFVPYLTLGGGYVDVFEGYQGRSALTPPEDRFFAIAGGGLEVPLFSALRLNAGVRTLVMSQQELSTLQDPDRLHASPLYTAGLEFSLGGRQPGLVERQAAAEEALRAARLEDEAERVNQEAARRRALAQLEEDLSEEALDQLTDDELQELVRLRMQEQALLAAPEPADTASNLSGRSITVPVPEHGEIYLRFGEPPSGEDEVVTYGVPSAPPQAGGQNLTAQEIRQIVRETLSNQLEGVDSDDLDVQRLADRLDRVEDRLENRIDEVSRMRMELLREREDVTVIEREDGQTSVRVERSTAPHTIWGRDLESVLPFTGFRLGEGPAQMLVGVRGDYRSPGGGWFRLMPEAALGFGGGTSINLAANAAVPIGSRYVPPYRPYAGLGIGLVSESGLSGLELGWNLLAGVEYPFRFGVAFAEFNTLNFFDFNRLMIGYRFAF